jgi:hypothetical protein
MYDLKGNCMSKVRKLRLTTIFTLTVLVLSCLPVGWSVSAQKFTVTSVVLKAGNAISGQCPVSITFQGSISADGPGTAQYQFTRSDGASGPTQTIQFKEAGTQSVSTSWTLGDSKSLNAYEGWVALKVVSPNELESAHDTGAFVMKCGGQQGGEESKSQWVQKVYPRPQGPQGSSPIDNNPQTQIVNGSYNRVRPLTDSDDIGNPRTSTSTGPPRPLASSFKVTLNGYRVEHQTRDDMFERD